MNQFFIMTTKTQNVRKRLVRSARTNSRRVHITPRFNGWALRKEGNLHATKIVDTQQKAIAIAKLLLKDGEVSAIIVHSKNGNFRATR